MRRAAGLALVLATACADPSARTALWPEAPGLIFTVAVDGLSLDIRGPYAELPIETTIGSGQDLFLVGIDPSAVLELHPRAQLDQLALETIGVNAPDCPNGRFNESSMSLALNALSPGAKLERVGPEGDIAPASAADFPFSSLELRVHLDPSSCPRVGVPGSGPIIDVRAHPPFALGDPWLLGLVDYLDETRVIAASRKELMLLELGETPAPSHVFGVETLLSPPDPAWTFQDLQVVRFASGPTRVFAALNRFGANNIVLESALVEMVVEGDAVRVIAARRDLPRIQAVVIDPDRGLLLVSPTSVLVATSTGGAFVETPFDHGLGPDDARFSGDPSLPHIVAGKNWLWRGTLDGQVPTIEEIAPNADSKAVTLEVSEDAQSILYASSRDHFLVTPEAFGHASWLLDGPNWCPRLAQDACGRSVASVETISNALPSTGPRLVVFYGSCPGVVFVDPALDCAATEPLVDNGAPIEVHAVARFGGRIVAMNELGLFYEIEEAR